MGKSMKLADTVTKISNEGRIHSGISDGAYMYLNGASFSETTPLPTLTKVDTSGKVIWTAIARESKEQFSGLYSSCISTFKSGNRLYTIALGSFTYGEPIPRTQVWCISDSSGEVLWKTSFQRRGIKIVDYSISELLLLAENESNDRLDYYIIDKTTGGVVFYKPLGIPNNLFYENKTDILVDQQKNILISINDTCKKFRDKYLNQLQWNSTIHPGGTLIMVDKIIQDSARYILFGNSNARAIDSATGSTIWFKTIPVGYTITPYQLGAAGRPKEVIIKDSSIYITWVSPFVGSVSLNRGFTLTKMNKQLGTINFNVAYDFNGVPTDAIAMQEELDWPMAMTMDSSRNIYITGSYDQGSGPETPSNWGIMKINGNTGSFIFESTITLDSSHRLQGSQGRFLHYFQGKMYCAGNAEKSYNSYKTWPIIVSFDTLSVYQEGFRNFVSGTYRLPSSLAGFAAFSSQKIALLKKVGKSSIMELRNINNQLIWSRTFSRNGRFVAPQNIKNLSDTSITASFIVYKQNDQYSIYQGKPDSLLFIRLDSTGTTVFQRTIPINNDDSIASFQLYSDRAGKTNFLFHRKSFGSNVYANEGFTLNSSNTTMGGIASNNNLQNINEAPSLKLTRVQHYNGDTMVYYFSNAIGSFPRNQGYLSSATQSTAGGYNYFGFRPIRDFNKVSSVIKLDSASFFITGVSESGTIIGARFNRKLTNPWVWSRISPHAGNMLNADTSASSIYCVSEKIGKKLYLSKINKLSSVQAWDFERSAEPNKSINPVDFKYNNISQSFTVGGYIVDSSSSYSRNSYFYITLDSLGNILRDITRVGVGLGETRINTLEVLQNGSNAYGGSLATSSSGTVGFYGFDCGNTVMPSINISASSTSICIGSPVTFTATTNHAGNSPTYQWQVNGINTGANMPTFTSTTLNNNDQVKCLLISNALCTVTNNTASNVITLAITAAVTPNVTIATSNTTICSGTSSTFTATPTNGGLTPTYQWKVNGVNAGTNSPIFITSNLQSTSLVSVIMTSSLSCVSSLSDTAMISVSTTPSPVANAGNDVTICAGTSTQLNASGGTSYSWSPATGLSNANIANPIATPLISTAYVLTVSNGICVSRDTVVVIVAQPSTPTVSISTANNNICSGSSITFTTVALNAGANPTFQWQVNGINAGTNSATFSSNSLQNNAQVKVIVTSNGCTTAPVVTSNTITINVTALAQPLVTLNTNVLTVTNADAAAVYTWQVLTNTIWGSVTPSATGINYTIIQPGEYRVKAEKAACTLYSASQVSSRTNTLDSTLYYIYLNPNPAKGLITVYKIVPSQNWTSLEVISLQGQRVLPSKDIRGFRTVPINVGNLAPGLYFVRLTNEDGRKISYKFVKE
jgi:hypothetical protein